MRMRDAVPPVEILIIRATFCGISMLLVVVSNPYRRRIYAT